MTLTELGNVVYCMICNNEADNLRRRGRIKVVDHRPLVHGYLHLTQASRPIRAEFMPPYFRRCLYQVHFADVEVYTRRFLMPFNTTVLDLHSGTCQLSRCLHIRFFPDEAP